MKNNEDTIRDYLIFTSGTGVFALPAETVREVLYPQTVTPLPFVPPAIDGLINVEGTIAVQINFSHLHGQAHHQGKELILIDTGRALCALKADEVKGRKLVDTTSIAPFITNEYTAFHAEIDSIEADFFIGKVNTEEFSALIIDHIKIGELVQAGKPPENSKGVLAKIADSDQQEEELNISCLVIKSGKDRYALELSGIMEIVETTDCTPIPNAPDYLKGYQLVRGQALPVIDFITAITGNNQQRQYNKVVIAERNNLQYGLLIDEVDGIEEFPLDTYEPNVESNSKYSGIFIFEEKTFALISPNKILDDENFEAILSHSYQNNEAETKITEESERYLKVNIDQEYYGIPLFQVKRVAPFFPMESLENPDGIIRGAIEIDGLIIPVIALEKSLAISNGGNENEYVIIESDKEQWAICVDSALGIVEIPPSQITNVAHENSQLIDRIANIEEKLIPLLDFSIFGSQKEKQAQTAY